MSAADYYGARPLAWSDGMQPATDPFAKLNPGLPDGLFERAARMLAEGARPRSVAFLCNAPLSRIDALAHELRGRARPC